jgi:hypothetical protein
MYSGPSASGANFVMPASATNTPRRNGVAVASIAHITSAPTSASLTLQFIAYRVNGKDAQAYASMSPRSGPRTRRPTRNTSSRHARSKKIDAAWAAGRSSQRPLHGMACSNGTYAT